MIAMTAGTAAAYGLSRFGSGGNLPLALVHHGCFRRWQYDPGDDHVGVFQHDRYLVGLVYGSSPCLAFWLMKTFFDDMPKEMRRQLWSRATRARVFWRITCR